MHFAEQTVATKVVRKPTVGGLFVTGNYNCVLGFEMSLLLVRKFANKTNHLTAFCARDS